MQVTQGNPIILRSLMHKCKVPFVAEVSTYTGSGHSAMDMFEGYYFVYADALGLKRTDSCGLWVRFWRQWELWGCASGGD